MSKKPHRNGDRFQQKTVELNDLKRLVEILEEVEILCGSSMTVESILDVSPKVTILLAEADRITRKHKDDLPDEFKRLGQEFLNAFSLYTQLYRAEMNLKNDLNRFIRLEVRKQRRLEAERSAQHREVPLCAFEGCKKPARVNEYCKRHAREMGIIVRGKIT